MRALICAMVFCCLLAAAADSLITDFEAEYFNSKVDDTLVFEGWEFSGDAFGRGPAEGLRNLPRRVSAYRGRQFVSSAVYGDMRVGSITSAPFVIGQRYLHFLIGGGNHAGETCVNLRVNGELLRSATGMNDDRFAACAFDLGDLQGKTARVEILDSHRGIWGHVNVDHILLSDEPSGVRVIQAPPSQQAPMWTIQTLAGREFGKPDREFTDLIYALSPARPMPAAGPHALWLRNGEYWRVEIMRLEGELLVLRSPLFGERKLPLAEFASLDFQPRAKGERKPGMLYRQDGEPIPGKLAWIKRESIAIECVLGVVPIPPERVERFVLGRRRSTPPESDEVGLLDGSVLYGSLSWQDGTWLLTHPTLGELKLALATLRYLRKRTATVTWLESLEPKVSVRRGPIGPPPAPKVLPGMPGYLRTLRLRPHTVLRYPLPAGAKVLRGIIAPVPGAAADSRVVLRSGEQLLWEQTVAATDAPVVLALDLPASDHLELELSFEARLGFPSGVDFYDAHIVGEAAE